MMENYIMTFEDGLHYTTNKLTDADIDALNDGVLTIIRTSDMKELDRDGSWCDLKKWPN